MSRTLTCTLVALLSGIASARDHAWRDLTDVSHLPDLSPYDLQWETGRERFDDTGRPIVRRDKQGRVILLDVPGPGVLVRFYGSPGGELTFEADGRTVVKAKTVELFRWHYEIGTPLSRGQPEPRQPFPFVWPVSARTQGQVSLVPIPFAKSLRVLGNMPVPQNNYAFAWVRGAGATPTASTGQAKAVIRQWRRAGLPTAVPGDARRVRGRTALGSGQTVSLFERVGAGTIRSLRVTLDPPNPMLERLLVLRCWWDGGDRPAVAVPLGDLCARQWGTGLPGALGGAHIVPGKHRNERPLEHTLYLRFPMPFATGARVELQLVGDAVVHRLDYELTWSPAALPPTAGRLYAVFRTGNWPAGQGAPVVRVKGPGKLVALSAANWDYPEGYAWDWQRDFDPVLTVDGQVRVRGNGLISPYYGGAGALENAHTPQFPLVGPPPRTASRHLLLDAVPFARSLDVHLDRFAQRTGGCRYSALAAWYGRPDAAPAPPAWRTRDLYWPTIRRQGLIEAEDLVATARAFDGEINVVTDTPGRFFLSARRMVTLVPYSPQARFAFRLPVRKAGQYRIATRSFHSLRSASLYEMLVNGQRSKHMFQGFYARFPGVGLAQAELDRWGTFRLTPDANRIVLVPNEAYAARQAVTNFLYALDGFLVEPVAGP